MTGYWSEKHLSEKHKKKISLGLEGNKCRLGIPHTDRVKKKISLANRRENHWQWKGGKRKTADGYITIMKPNHPFCIKSGYVLEHRLVMEQWLREHEPSHPALIEINGVKYLKPEWVPHHKNGKKDDNRIENLELMTHVHHSKIHSTGRKQGIEAKKKMSLAKIGTKNPYYFHDFKRDEKGRFT